jgi:hypothetical protein
VSGILLMLLHCVVAWAAGAAVVSLGLGAGPAGSRLLLAAVALPLGLGLGSAAFAASLFAGASRWIAAGWVLGGLAALALAGFAVICGGRRWSRRAEYDRAGSERPTRAALALAAIVACFALPSLVRLALAAPEGGWDALMVWNLRARMLFHAGNLRDAFPADVVTSHPDYPLLVPGLIVQLWTLAGSADPRIPLAVSVVLGGAACAGILTGGLAERSGGRQASVLANALLWSTPGVLAATVSQTADQLMALFVLAAGVVATRAVERSGARTFMLAGVLAACAAWTKNEGAAFLLALAAGIVLRRGWRFGSWAVRDGAVFAAGALPLVTLLAWFKISVAPHTNAMFQAEALASKLLRGLDVERAATVLLFVLRRLVYFQAFGLHVVAVAAVLVVLAVRGALARPAVRVLAITLGATWAAYVAVYLVAPFDAKWLVQHSADRLLLQCWPLALFLVFVAVSEPLAASAPPTTRVDCAIHGLRTDLSESS